MRCTGAREQRAEITHCCASASTHQNHSIKSQQNGLTGEAEEAEDTPQEGNSLLKINKNWQKVKRVKNKCNRPEPEASWPPTTPLASLRLANWWSSSRWRPILTG